MIGLTLFLKRHSRALYLVFVLLSVLGFLAFENLPSDVYPSLSFPRIAVIIGSGDMAPERVLVSITRLLEEACSQVYRVRWIRSKTIRGASELSVEFQNGTDMIFSLHQLQARVAEVQSRLPAGTSVTVELVTPAIFPVLSYNIKAPVEVRVFGEDPAKLKALSVEIEGQLRSISGLVDIACNLREGAPEFEIKVDGVRAGKVGLTPGEVTQQVQDALFGRPATQVKRGDRLVTVRVRLNERDRLDADRLGSLPIIGNGGHMLPLSALASIRSKSGEQEILCENQQRYASISASLEGRDLGSAVTEVRAGMAKLRLPLGYSLDIAGLYRSQQETFEQLSFVFVLSSVLVYLLLVTQFRSFVQPLAIFAALPLALVGVFAGLNFTDTPLNVSSFMGMILLIGLVVKNGIILLEYANRLQDEGISIDEALGRAGEIRLRPILMTTLCTLLGLLPLACGSGTGAELQKPLAIAVISGLSVSTIFTLLVVPAVYKVLQKFAGSRFVANPAANSDQ